MSLLSSRGRSQLLLSHRPAAHLRRPWTVGLGGRSFRMCCGEKKEM